MAAQAGETPLPWNDACLTFPLCETGHRLSGGSTVEGEDPIATQARSSQKAGFGSLPPALQEVFQLGLCKLSNGAWATPPSRLENRGLLGPYF